MRAYVLSGIVRKPRIYIGGNIKDLTSIKSIVSLTREENHGENSSMKTVVSGSLFVEEKRKFV